MNAETTAAVYPGNPSLPREVKEKILSTFRHTLNLFHEGKLDDCIIGCDFILKMDARFAPGRQLLEKARNPASAVDVAQLEAIVATTPTRQERVVAADPGKILVRAVESFNARDFDAAISAAQNVLEILPGNQDAREILEKATRKKSSQPVFDASRERALAALESNRKDDARIELDKMRTLDADHPAVALLERRIGPSAPPAKPQGTVANAVPPPPPNFGGLDLDFPEEPSAGGFGAETREPEIQFDDNATVAMKVPSSMVSPPDSSGDASGLDSLSLDSLSLDMPGSISPLAPPAPVSRGLTGPLQDSPAASVPAPSIPSASPGSPADLWSDGGGGNFDLEAADEPHSAPDPPLSRPPAAAPPPMVDSLESVDEDSTAGEREIEGLLRQGDDAAARGDRQQAIEIWSRIFLIDINNTDAVVRIENARQEMADGNRVVSDGLKAGREKYEAGDLAGARELFLQVLAIDENEPTARFHLDRIEDDMARGAQAPSTEPSDAVPGQPTAAEEAAGKPARAAAKPGIRLSVQPKVLAMVGIFAALVLGLVYFFVLRPPRSGAATSAAGAGAAAGGSRGSLATARQLLGAGKIAEARAELRRVPPSSADREEAQRMLSELGKSGAPESAAAAPAAPETGAAPASAVDADAAKVRVTAERALAEKRYIDALKGFSQAAPAFRNDPTFAQSMGAASEKVTGLTPAVKLYNEGEYETAIPVLWRIYQEDRENQDAKSYLFRAYFNQGVSQLQNGQYPKAIESFRESLTLDPADAEAVRHRKFAERYQKTDLDLMGRIYVRHLNHRP
ncbi:MAG: tetratricopeptide repeat protein [Acidobacteriota bacterium]|nr:tetratricopeptide repeat protein [Acidobacteriota bacterium]